MALNAAKKKKKKNMAVLLGMAAALVVLIAGYLAVSGWKDKKENQDDDEEDEVLLYSLESDRVSALEVRAGDYEVTLTRGQSGWENAQDSEFPLDQNAVGEMLDLIAGFQAERLVLKQAGDLSEYGLDTPAVRIGIRDTDGGEAAICIGDRSLVGESYYACLEGSRDVYFISEENQEVFDVAEQDLMFLDTVPVFSADSANGLKVSGGRFPEFTIAASEEDEHDLTAMALYTLSLSGVYREPVSVDLTSFSELMGDYTAITLGNLAGYHAADKEKYGLDNPADALTVWYQDSGNAQQEFTIYFGDMDADETGYYVNLEGSNQIFLMDKESAQALLMPDTFQAVNKYTQMVNIKIVGGLNIVYDNQSISIGITHTETGEDGSAGTSDQFSVNGKELGDEDGEAVRDVYQALIGMKLTRALKEDEIIMDETVLGLEFLEDGTGELLHSVRYLALEGNTQEYAIEVNGTSLFATDAETVETVKKLLEEM